MRENLFQLLESNGGDLSTETILLRLAMSAIIAAFLFLSYRLSHSGSIYSAKFNVSLMALTVITTTVMIVIGNNIALSLGMVGALSIVRFRTAIKEPMDIAFLFWSIAAGIVLAAGFIPLAVFGSMFIGLILLIFSSRRDTDAPYILVVHCDSDEAEQRAAGLIRDRAAAAVIKSKSVSAGCIELNYEVRLKDGAASFVNELAGMEGVSHAVLVSYNGDYMG